MDEFNMDELELPSMDSLDTLGEDNYNKKSSDTELDDALFEDPNSVKGAPLSDDLSDIDVPVIADMLGDDLPPITRPDAPAKPAEPIKPMFAEMGAPEPAQNYTPAENKVSLDKNTAANTASETGYKPVSSRSEISGAYDPSEKASYAYASPAPKPTQNRNSYHEELEHMYDEKRELYESGRKKAQVLGTILIITNGLSALSSLGSLNLFGIGSSALRIYFAWTFMKGSGKWRIWLGALCALGFIAGIVSMVLMDSTNALFAEFEMGWVVTLVQLILIGETLINGAMAYFFILDKSVAAYANE